MAWQLWLVVAVLVLECVGPIYRVGRVRPPLTTGQAIAQFAQLAALIGLVIWGAS